jgi:SMC interacting uncharacterized protein involved in chromosome segregation
VGRCVNAFFSETGHISKLKLRIQELETQQKLLKAKIQRMQMVIQKRSSSIRSVFSQPVDEQSIRTASPTTLQQVREQKSVLLHTLEVHERGLDAIQRSDRVQFGPATRCPPRVHRFLRVEDKECICEPS